MENIVRDIRENPFIKNWWSFVLRGLAAIVFGILTFVLPGLTLSAIILLFAAYALVEGVMNVIGAIRGIRSEKRALLLLVQGLVSIAAGVIALAAPGLTAIALLYVIAFWAIVTGCIEIAAAIRLRKEVEGEWMLGLGGVLSILFGVLLIASPGLGALVMVYQIGLYAVVFGGIQIALGLRLRSWGSISGGRTAPRFGGGI
jgi:uncharacterized membrane protein HdeD (DUF308 family)